MGTEADGNPLNHKGTKRKDKNFQSLVSLCLGGEMRSKAPSALRFAGALQIHPLAILNNW